MSKIESTVKTPVTELTAAIFPESVNDTSKKIRFLRSLDYSVAEIEKALKIVGVTTKNGDPIRYQHVRNVLNTIIKS